MNLIKTKELKILGFFSKKYIKVFLSFFGIPKITEELVVFYEDKNDTRLEILPVKVKLVFKKTIYRNPKLRKEVEIIFTNNEVESILQILNYFGLKKGLISYAMKIQFPQKGRISCEIRFTQKANFYMLNKSVFNKYPAKKEFLNLKKLAEKLKLKYIEEDDFNLWMKKQLQNVNRDKLIKGKIIHRDLRNILKPYIINVNKSIKSILKMKSNDYSLYDKIFYILTHKHLDDQKSFVRKPFTPNFKFSIILPVYNTLDTLSKSFLSIQHQKLPESLFKKGEIILVDDGSQEKIEEIYYNLKNSCLFNIKLIINKENLGRSAARNLGASIAIDITSRNRIKIEKRLKI